MTYTLFSWEHKYLFQKLNLKLIGGCQLVPYRLSNIVWKFFSSIWNITNLWFEDIALWISIWNPKQLLLHVSSQHVVTDYNMDILYNIYIYKGRANDAIEMKLYTNSAHKICHLKLCKSNHNYLSTQILNIWISVPMSDLITKISGNTWVILIKLGGRVS